MVWGCHFQSLSEAASFSSKKNELFHGMIYKQFICSLVDENLDCSQLGAIMNKDVIKILGLKKKKKEKKQHLSSPLDLSSPLLPPLPLAASQNYT